MQSVEPPHLLRVAVPRKTRSGPVVASSHKPVDDGFVFALHLFPQLDEWLPLLRKLSIRAGDAAYFASLAARNGTDFQTELLASGIVAEVDYCEALARQLGIGHAISVDPDRLIVSDEFAAAFLRRSSWHLPIKLAERNGATSYLIVPSRLGIGHLSKLIASHPKIRERLRMVAPRTLREALMSRLGPTLVRQATNDLFDRYPDLSARIVASAWQGAIVGAMLIALPAAVWLSPGGSWVAMHILCSIFFLSCVGLRIAAAISGRLAREPDCDKPSPADLPVYSVLVALYREAAVVPELVAALRRIDWPSSKLEIKLVCEEDDVTTLAALDTQALPPNMEVVRVPIFGPRTKPKALAYALPLTGGEFVALYDAEDQPHPGQLLSAWRKFDGSPADVACVQAPLEIDCSGGGLLARMFSFEYAGLFRGLLPWLSANQTLLPLGGTSNHFRRSALEEVGGWDPYNVTEDADLGVRLARFGYRTETIACPTVESSPETFATWLPQRTRWFKGWLQTWLVHMRHPALLMVELRPASFVVGQILCAGMVLSALAHPFLFISGIVLAVDLALERPSATWKSALLAVDIVNVGCGYLSFLLLGWRNLRLGEKLGFWKVVLFTPVYWMMMSIAAWRAVWQLWRRPHLWEKTPHRPMGRVAVA